uniref:Ubiquitin-like protease family profile domain-containing protein n=1 Tax=Panagrolaimus davidi TaxID=227884 RepID=A0A914PJZ6_9BILA
MTIFAFPMVFFANLCSGGYEKVKRYTRKEDVFKKEIWLVPILRQKHWTLVTVDFRNQQIDYHDSLLGEYKEVFDILLSYMSSEFKDKKNEDFEITGWTFQHKKNIPTQLNGSDCGIFVCKYAEYVSRRAEFDFDQQDMPHFRKEMVWEILQQRLMNE